MKDKPTVDVSSSLRSPPLVEPDRRFYRIRLSEVVHRSRYRGHPLRTATQCPLKRAPLSRRCYLPQGSHRTVLRFAVHIDQVRPLRSSPVVMTGQRVVQASPVCHRVCFGPVLAGLILAIVLRERFRSLQRGRPHSLCPTSDAANAIVSYLSPSEPSFSLVRKI